MEKLPCSREKYEIKHRLLCLSQRSTFFFAAIAIKHDTQLLRSTIMVGRPIANLYTT